MKKPEKLITIFAYKLIIKSIFMVENKDQVNIPEVDLSLMIIIFITQKIETLRVHATPGLSIDMQEEKPLKL